MPHPKVSYLEGSGDALPLPDHSIDIVTFAGSLFYAKSEKLACELQRACQKGALIICYDFEVILESALERCGLSQEKIESDYDHEMNLSDYDNFVEILLDKQSVQFNVSAEELVHILLSDSYRYKQFVNLLGVENPFLELVKRFENESNQLNAMTYFSKYKLQ